MISLRKSLPLSRAAALFCAAALWQGASQTVPAQEKDKPAAEEKKPAVAVAKSPAENGVSATTEAQVDGLLFFATNEAVDSATADAKEDEKGLGEEKLSDIRTRLGKSFPGTRTFQLMGRHTQKVFKEYESWVVPSKDLCLKVDSRGPVEGGGISLHLQLWQGKKVLVKSDATLKPKQPVFIGGPNWRKGRLIFVVLLHEEAAK